MKKHKRIRRTKVEMILEKYKELCTSRKEDRFGYRQALDDARKRAGKFHKIPDAKKFVQELEQVIFNYRLQECFPYSQAFFYLRDMVVDRIEELVKESN
ncbi:MAG: hypothetical protein ABFD15_02200 [Methanofastidiosum sp.]